MDLTAALKNCLDSKPGNDPVVLELDLSRGVLTSAPSSPLVALRMRNATTMRALRDALRHGAQSDSVAGLVVHVGPNPLPAAIGDEVAELISEFAKARPTIAWSESFGELSNATLAYRVASAASEIWLQPSGALGLNGVSAQILLLRGLAEKAGLEPQFAQRQEYKSAGEQFAGKEVSEANREMTTRIAQSILDDTIAVVAERRRIDPEKVREIVDASPVTAKVALEAGLVDRLGYRDEVYADLKRRWGRMKSSDRTAANDSRPTEHSEDGEPRDDESSGKVFLQYAHRYARAHGEKPWESLFNRTRPAIAVVNVNGSIVTGPSHAGGPGGSQAGSDTIAAHLREAGRDDKVKAVILRVDSPGGSYIASDVIRREVLQLKKSGRPVIASMGGVAASGGYFVSMAADAIVANPTTLTGSIGVLAGQFVTDELFDKLDLIRERINAGANAAFLSGARFTDTQWDALNSWLDDVYADFTGKAAKDRQMEYGVLEPLARGRVWTGVDARTKGLVDELGGMDKAIELAAERVGMNRDDLQLRGVPALPWLDQVKPAESSESGTAATISAPSLAEMINSGPEGMLAGLAQLAGVTAPRGALALPWDLRIG